MLFHEKKSIFSERRKTKARYNQELTSIFPLEPVGHEDVVNTIYSLF